MTQQLHTLITYAQPCGRSIVHPAHLHMAGRRRYQCPGVLDMTTVDRLAALIREVDGNHDMGAAALAEALVERGVTI